MDHNSAGHFQKLLVLCRICGNTTYFGSKLFVKFKSSLCSDFRIELLELFGLDICNDDSDIHPHTLCGACTQTLRRHRLKQCATSFSTDGLKLLFKRNKPLWVPFSPVTNNACLICSRQKKSAKQRTREIIAERKDDQSGYKNEVSEDNNLIVSFVPPLPKRNII